MAIKTISLELDAYEKLRAAKRPGESFSAVVRRARFEPAAATGEAVLKRLKAMRERSQWPGAEPIRFWDKVRSEQRKKPRISSSKWNGNQSR